MTSLIYYFILKGATVSNRYRIQEFRSITKDTQKLCDELIAKQEISINELKKELLNSSSKDSSDHLVLLNEQSEQRIQTQLIYHTGFLIISASVISIIVSYFYNR